MVNTTYEGKTEVSNSDLYDLASLTKVNATTLAIMKLVEDSVIKLSDPLSKYLENLDTTNKQDITLKAGINAYIWFKELDTVLSSNHGRPDGVRYDIFEGRIGSFLHKGFR